MLNQSDANIADADERTMRTAALDLLRRLGWNDYARDLIVPYERVMQNVLRIDNEENASVACVIITELYKTYTAVLQPQTRAFVEFVVERLRSLPALVESVFAADADKSSDSSSSSSSSLSSLAANSDDKAKPDADSSSAVGSLSLTNSVATSAASSSILFLPGTQSFRILTEIINLLHFMLHLLPPEHLQQAVPQLFEPMVSALNALPPANAPLMTRSGSRSDLSMLHMRTISLLVAFQRDFAKQVSQFGDIIAKATVQLVAQCPPEAVSVRKAQLDKYVLMAIFSPIDLPCASRVLSWHIRFVARFRSPSITPKHTYKLSKFKSLNEVPALQLTCVFAILCHSLPVSDR